MSFFRQRVTMAEPAGLHFNAHLALSRFEHFALHQLKRTTSTHHLNRTRLLCSHKFLRNEFATWMPWWPTTIPPGFYSRFTLSSATFRAPDEVNSSNARQQQTDRSHSVRSLPCRNSPQDPGSARLFGSDRRECSAGTQRRS